ncbi:phosphoesterase PA-phosphatase [Streptomyces sp. NP160]|uniref:phosphoesterase PA-phosphatase n=1 Tax=Streptomyces sp. NP160 TaxID=2586637 RepID=UPI0011184F3D|nr:phosphoesterase PA-phosphatase [Streptomyces sp. NP160]TNM59948.1 phosphoesterase PA-phosphatase [Streptomyces sp. NP160]
MADRPGPPRWARWASEALAPAALAAVVPLVVGAAAAGWAGVALAAVGAVVAVVPGVLLVVHLVRRGRVVDHHLPDRADRPRVLGAVLVGVVAAAALQVLLSAPPALRVLFSAMAVLLAVLVLMSTRWKVSLHAAAAAASLGALVAALGPWALVGAPLVAVLGAARVRLGAHTPAQVLVGLALGAVAAAAAAALTG